MGLHDSRLRTPVINRITFFCSQNIFILQSFSIILLPSHLTSCTVNKSIYILALLRSGSTVCHFYTETARSTFPLVNPCSCCLVFVVSVWFPILEVSQQMKVLQGEIISLTPNPQPRGPGYPFLLGSSPLTCLENYAIPVVSLPPGQFSGSFDPTSPTTTSKQGYLQWGATVTKMFQLPQIFKTKHCISEASSGETAHLKKVPMDNICVSVAYINDINYNNITINNYKHFSHNFHIFLCIKSSIIYF